MTTGKLFANVLHGSALHHARGNVSMRLVGSLDLLDFQIVNQARGQDPLPFPFMLTRPTRFEWADDMADYAATVPDRVRYGDLDVFRRCLEAWDSVDISVVAHVQFIPDDIPSTRLLAFRSGQAGFCMIQQPDADSVEVYSVSPRDLAAVIAERMPDLRPGQHRRIEIPEYTQQASGVRRNGVEHEHDRESDSVVVRDAVQSSPGVRIAVDNVTAFATVQSRWRPVRNWGIDWDKAALVWVRVADDGDYIASPDYSHGTPMTAAHLTARLEALLVEDSVNLTDSRDDW